ncbi:MAG: YCF48-related protein [Patescibacteria group bacterium]
MRKSFLVIIPVFVFLAASPFQCSEISSDGGIFKSLDQGENWQQLTINDQVSLASLDISTIEVNPNDSNVLYAGTRNDGLYKSCCQGEHWYRLEDKNRALSNKANIYDIAIDPKDPNRIYLGTYQDKKGRVFRSQDGGESWEEVYLVSEEKYAVFAVEVDNYDSSIVYIGTAQGGFLRSADYGKSWEIKKWFDDVVSDIVINPKNTREVYVSTFQEGIYKTTDKGDTWQSFEDVLKDFRQARRVENLLIDSQRPNIVYAGSEYGLLATKNGGQTWQEVAIVMPPESKPVLSLAIESENTDNLYYGAGSILYRSLDQGKTWTVHELNSQRNVKTIAIDPKNPEVIYVGMQEEE